MIKGFQYLFSKDFSYAFIALAEGHPVAAFTTLVVNEKFFYDWKLIEEKLRGGNVNFLAGGCVKFEGVGAF